MNYKYVIYILLLYININEFMQQQIKTEGAGSVLLSS
jgi:hypothetical protein